MGERKYSQRGYMEEEARDRGRSKAPRSEREGPRGRGLGAPTVQAFKCARCGADAAFDERIDIDVDCASCGEALHSCVNCRHFDTAARNECSAGVEKRVAGKSKRNECAEFEPKIVQGFGSDASDGDAKKAFDDLFDF